MRSGSCIQPTTTAMERIHIPPSNKTSVITKRVSQTFETGITSYHRASPETMIDHTPPRFGFSPGSPSSAGSSPRESFLLAPEPAAMFNTGYYDLYYEAKSKRKPIPVPIENKDEAYWERRRRNNESAKRSREIRRLKELQTNKRIHFLEQENVKLQTEVKFLREEIGRLRGNEILPYLVRNSIK